MHKVWQSTQSRNINIGEPLPPLACKSKEIKRATRSHWKPVEEGHLVGAMVLKEYQPCQNFSEEGRRTEEYPYLIASLQFPCLPLAKPIWKPEGKRACVVRCTEVSLPGPSKGRKEQSTGQYIWKKTRLSSTSSHWVCISPLSQSLHFSGKYSSGALCILLENAHYFGFVK